MIHTHKKINRHFMVVKKNILLFGTLCILPVLLVGFFLITRGLTPYTSELAITEYSVLGTSAGSVIPASGESYPSYGYPSYGYPSYGYPSYGYPSYGYPSYGYPSYGYPSYPDPAPAPAPPSYGYPSYQSCQNNWCDTEDMSQHCPNVSCQAACGGGTRYGTKNCSAAPSYQSYQSYESYPSYGYPSYGYETYPPPPTVTLNPFNPSLIITGNAASISFSSTNVTSCSGFGTVNGNLGSTGSTLSTGIINTPGIYTQSVTCSGPGGSITSGTQALVVDGPPSISDGSTGLTISPRSVDRGGLVKLTWGIHYPNTSCRITAAVQIPATCNASCQSDRATASSTLNSTLSSGTTNANDPYGANRNMTTAITTKAASLQYARGEKSLTIDYSTTFTLSCGNAFTAAKTIIYVIDETEG